MNDLAMRMPLGGRLIGSVRDVARAVWECYRHGWKALIAVPVLAAIAAIPEFAQHVVEIQIGMFGSSAAFHAHGNDHLRWAFGIPKLIGFLAAILLIARYWALGSVRRAVLVPPMTLLRVVVTIGAAFLLAWPFDWLGKQGLPMAVNLPLQAVSLFIQAGVTIYLVGALLQDPAITLRRAYTSLLPAAVVMTLLLVVTFAPAQGVHLANHRLASGQPLALVWALMTFDALWIGFFAALVGSALFVGYRTGLTWRGWTVRPADLATEPAGTMAAG